MKPVKTCLYTLLAFALFFMLLPTHTLAQKTSGSYAADTYSSEVIEVNPLYEDVISPQKAKHYYQNKPSSGSSLLNEADEDDLSSFFYMEDAAGYIRQSMKKRTAEISFYYITTELYTKENVADSLIYPLFEMAQEETGVPTEGDYIRFQWGSYKCSISTKSQESEYRYSITYSVTYYTTLEQENAVTAEVDRILKELDFDNKTVYEKVEAIYRYLSSTVTYDYDNLNDNDYTLKYSAYAALIDHTAVCQGYAVAMYRLLMESDLSCRVIIGTAHDDSHAWNIIRLGKYWYNADSTWESSSYKEGEPYRFFLLNMESFTDHERGKDYTTVNFKRSYPMSPDNYDRENHTACDISEYSASLSEETFTYNGKEHTPDVTVEGLTEGIDYTISYANNLHAGTASAIVTGIDEFTGTITLPFTIKPKTLTSVSAKGYSGYYDGKSHSISVTAPKECTITYATSKKGTYSTKKPSYQTAGSYTTYYKVSKTDYTTVSGSASVKINLKQPSVSASNASSGITVKWSKISGADGYYLYQKTSTGWKRIKTITGASKISFTHTGLKNGSKYTYTVRAYNKNTKSSYMSGRSIYRLDRPSISSLKNSSKKKMTVTWKKNTKATGYQIQYSTNSSFSSCKTTTVSKNSTVSKTITSLTKGKRYYVRVRSYKTVSKTNYYSSWSPVKNIKISK